MNDFISLKIIDKFRFLYEKIGVDYNKLRLILKTKLTMDSRKNFNLLKNQGFDESKNQYKIMQIIYLVIGFFLMILTIVSNNIFIAMSIYFAMFMFLIFTTFVADFSSVVLDVKDKTILGTKGVDLKTLNASKVTHIMIYVVNTSFTLSGFLLIASLKYGFIFFLVFLIEILIIDIFMVVLSALIYLIILKLFDGEKLKDIITIMQIVFSILFSLGYIVVMNMSNNMSYFENIKLGVISYFLPPFWFSALLEVVALHHISKQLLILSFLALAIPLVSVLMYVSFIPVFEKSIQKLNNEGFGKKYRKHDLSRFLSKLVCTNKEEKVFFDFTTSIIRRDKDFKSIVYTILGSNLVFIFINFDKDISDLKSFSYLLIYLYITLTPTVIIALKRSRDYEASYLYTTMPIKNKMNVHKGAIKACLVNIIIPVYLLICALYIYFGSVSILKDLVVIFFVNIFIVINTFNIIDKSMPFSRQVKVVNKSDYALENALMCVLIFIMAGLHAILSFIGPIYIYIYVVVILMLNMILYKLFFKEK